MTTPDGRYSERPVGAPSPESVARLRRPADPGAGRPPSPLTVLIGGGIGTLVGTAIAAAGTSQDTGLLVWVGDIVAGLCTVVVLVAIIAIGVAWGIRRARE